MRTKLSRMLRGMLLVAWIGIPALLFVGTLYAINCQTQQCVNVAYAEQSPTDPSNKYAWFTTFSQTEGGQNTYTGGAYSYIFAAKGYGSVSDASKPIVDPDSTKSGNVRACKNSTSDCDQGSGNGIIPVSGSVGSYLGPAKNLDFFTKCKAMSPSQ